MLSWRSGGLPVCPFEYSYDNGKLEIAITLSPFLKRGFRGICCQVGITRQEEMFLCILNDNPVFENFVLRQLLPIPPTPLFQRGMMPLRCPSFLKGDSGGFGARKAVGTRGNSYASSLIKLTWIILHSGNSCQSPPLPPFS